MGILSSSLPVVSNIAHRGARAFAPENTLPAFAKAKEFGCNMVELDVRLSKDTEVIVFHDEQLKRCTDAEQKLPGLGSYLVADFSYAELSRLDAGSWFVRQLALAANERQPFLQGLTVAETQAFIQPDELSFYASGLVKIPTLAEALQLADDLDLQVNIELKALPSKNGELADSVVNIIANQKMVGKVLISSFEQDLLRQVRRRTKKLKLALLVGKPIAAPLTTLRNLRAKALNLGCYDGYATSGFQSKLGEKYLAYIEKIRATGTDVNVWTCNNPEEMRHLLAAGVNGIISDFPNRVSSLITNEAGA